MFCMALTNTVCNEMSDMCFFVGQLENKITICFKSLLSEKSHITFASLSSD